MRVEKSVPEGEGGDKQMRIAQYSAYYSREIALYLWGLLDKPVGEWELDDVVERSVKEGWSKRENPKVHVKRGRAGELLDAVRGKVKCVDVRKGTFEELPFCEEAKGYAGMVQLRSVGFLSNKRQHRQFGLAVLEASQMMRGGGAATKWRECFNVLVKWRQISEPNDPVWWIDKLGKKTFEEGFGLQTPLVAGELRVFRYFPYYRQAFGRLKKLCCIQCGLGKDASKIVEGAKDLNELWNIVGEDFWVVVPCLDMEGTRLTLQKIRGAETAENISNNEGEGFSFTIRTPSTPERFNKFEKHFDALWSEVVIKGDGSVAEGALKVFYYWVCFAPLTRGSAAVGYGMFAAILRVRGKRVKELPEDKQLDWEAILAESEEAFVGKWRGWLEGAWVEIEVNEGEIEVGAALPTLRSRIIAMI
jgi:hypothetical protein